MEPGHQSIILQAREHRTYGRFAAAVTLLTDALSEQNSIGLATELGEILLLQGYINRAIKVLGENIFKSKDEFISGESGIMAARMLFLYVDFHATGAFKECLDEADRIYDAYLSSESSEEVNDDYLRIETYYCAFYTLANKCGETNSKYDASRSIGRISRAFNVFANQGNFYHALDAAKTLYSSSPEAETSLLLELLEKNKDVPGIYQAEARCTLSKNLNEPQHREEQDKLWNAAMPIFEQAGHAHRPLDIKIRLACRYPLDAEGPPVEEIVGEFLKTYEQVDYPIGLLSALLTYAELAEKLCLPQWQTAILADHEELCKQVGLQISWYLARILGLAVLAKSGREFGSSIRVGTTLWNDLGQTDCSIFRCQAAERVALAYSALKRNEEAVEWWEKAQEHPRALGPISMPRLERDIERFGEDKLEQTFQETVRLAEIDVANGALQLAVDRLDNFLGDCLTLQRATPEYFDMLERVLGLADRYNNALPDSVTTRKKRASLLQSKATIISKGVALKPDVEAEMEAIAVTNEAKQIYLADNWIPEATMVLQRQALIYVGVFQKFKNWRDPQAQHALQTALDLNKIVLDSAIGLNLYFVAIDAAYWVAHCQYRQWERGWGSYEIALESLLHAESFIDRRRQELSVLNKVEAIDIKRRLSSDPHSRQIYQMAVHIAKLSCNSIDAWDWVQKSKARSLSDLLGLGIFIPRELEARIKNDEEAGPLFEKEQVILEEILTAAEHDLYPLRVKLDIIRGQMRGHAQLRELISLREGYPAKFDTLRDISKGQDGKISTRFMIYVDWVIIRDEIHMCVVRRDGEPTFTRLSIGVEAVEKWISKYLNSDDNPTVGEGQDISSSGLGREDTAETGPLRDLDALVAPLQSSSEPEDLLVFCPTGILHSLPLHALRVGPAGAGEVLIARNPIVYCASLTSFAQCSQRAAPDERRGSLGPGRFFAVYEPWYKKDLVDERFRPEERDEAYASVESLADSFTGMALTATDATRDKLKESLETSSMVHFLGHCDFDAKPVSEQALQISDGRAAADGSCTVEPLFVTDILSLHIRAPHVSILGCGTASQHYEAGDEPLGLVSAFLAAGASSVLGALWPIETTTARAFSERFYGYVRDDPACRKYGVWDLAYAAREATLDVMTTWRTRHPYQWAPFVLHGTWFVSDPL